MSHAPPSHSLPESSNKSFSNRRASWIVKPPKRRFERHHNFLAEQTRNWNGNPTHREGESCNAGVDNLRLRDFPQQQSDHTWQCQIRQIAPPEVPIRYQSEKSVGEALFNRARFPVVNRGKKGQLRQMPGMTNEIYPPRGIAISVPVGSDRCTSVKRKKVGHIKDKIAAWLFRHFQIYCDRDGSARPVGYDNLCPLPRLAACGDRKSVHKPGQLDEQVGNTAMMRIPTKPLFFFSVLRSFLTDSRPARGAITHSTYLFTSPN